MLDEFLALFESVQPKINAFPGCRGVKLLKQIDQPNVMMTYSLWESPDNLENYRQSALFETTWAKTKAMFSTKAEAWSMEEIV